MLKRLHLLMIAWLISSLAGCAMQARKPVKPAEPVLTAPAPAESIYAYIATTMASTQELQKKEVLQLNQALANTKPDDSTLLARMKLAALYGLPNSRVRDPAKAQALLDQLLREPALENDHRVLAGLLKDYVADTTKLNAKVRDEQKRADTLQSRLDNLQSKTDSAQQRADNLQRKLDELKNIEKTMIDRGQGSPK